MNWTDLEDRIQKMLVVGHISKVSDENLADACGLTEAQVYNLIRTEGFRIKQEEYKTWDKAHDALFYHEFSRTLHRLAKEEACPS